MDFELVVDGLAFPEGPVVMPDGSVIVVELAGGRLTRAWGDGRKEVIAELGGGPNGAQIGPDGAVYVCNNGGSDRVNRCHLDTPEAIGRIERVDLATGKFERVYDHCGDFPLRAPNDLVFDADGGMWFTDHGKQLRRSTDHGALYHCRPDGSRIEEAWFGGVTCNGVVLSADESKVYVAETRTARLYEFTLIAPGKVAQGPDGKPARPRLVGTAPGDVWLDSMATLASGTIAVATLRDGGITSFAPDGTIVSDRLPDPYTTNIAFGGADMRTAYITLSETGRLIRTRWREPGLRLNFS